MPMCPNCGGWVSEGSSTCSCGTPVSDFANVPDEVDKDEIKREVSNEIIENMVQRRTREAKRLAEKERYAEAIEKYDEALDIKYSTEIVREIAELYFKMGEYEKALEEYDSIDDRRGVAMTLIELERCDEAIDVFETLIEGAESKFPNPDFHQDWASDEDYVQRYKKRCQYREEEKFRYLAIIYNDLGWAYNKKEDYGKAIECYEKGIGYDPDFAENWNCKAIALNHQGKYVEALKFYDIALEIDVADKTILKNKEGCLKSYGKAYLSGKYPVKSDFLERALELAAEDSEVSDSNVEASQTDKPGNEQVRKEPDNQNEMDYKEQTDFLKSIGKENLITIAEDPDYYHPKFERGMDFKLAREKDNLHDDAIAVYLFDVKVAYVADDDDACCYLTSKASDIQIKDTAHAEYLLNYYGMFHIAQIISYEINK